MSDERRAPVQGFAAGIPWSMHLRAYDAYCKMYGKQQALIEGNCRGGFGDSELDMFIPGWREELSELAALKAKLAEAEAARDQYEIMAMEGKERADREQAQLAAEASRLRAVCEEAAVRWERLATPKTDLHFDLALRACAQELRAALRPAPGGQPLDSASQKIVQAFNAWEPTAQDQEAIRQRLAADGDHTPGGQP